MSVLLFSLGGAQALELGSDIVPADAGALNVKDFGAVGDGMHDDTQAFLKALAQSSVREDHWHVRVVAIPAGVYRVTDTITKRFADGSYNAGMVLIGAGQNRTIIRLAERSAAFQDATHPRAVIYTAGKGFAQSPKDGYALRGEGNDGFSNFIENLSVDVGNHNPGAIGIDYLANNQGAIRAVNVTGQGRVGIAMTRAWVGPALLEDVKIDGFDVGIDVASINYGVTVDGLQLTGQHEVALRNRDNLVAVRGLEIHVDDAKMIAIQNFSASSMLIIDGGHVSGSADALHNDGVAYVRDLVLSGSNRFLNASLPASGTVEGIYQGSQRLSDATPGWALQGTAVPLPAADAVSKWVSVAAFGARPDGVTDASAAFKAAFASGAHTVYIPFGVYLLKANLDVPDSVHRIVGMNSTIVWLPAQPDRSIDDPTKGLLRSRNTSQSLLIEQLFFSCPMGRHTAVEQVGTGPLILRDIVGMGVVFQRDAEGGPLFLTDVSGGFLVHIMGKAPAQLRQVDSEGGGARGGPASIRIANDGAAMWALGLKSEGDNTLVANSNGAVTDIVGAFVAPLQGATQPLFSSADSKLDATGVELAFKPGMGYHTVLAESSNGTARETDADSFPPRPTTTGFFFPRVLTR